MKSSKKQSQSSEQPVPELDLGQLERLLSFMTEHGLEEFEYAHGDLHIRLKKAAAPLAGGQPRALPSPPENAAVAAPQPQQVAGPPAAEPPPPVPVAPAPTPPPAEELHIVKSPIVGTFYASPNPDAAPYVKMGDTVQPGQTICIIEAMKLMNEIEADIAGEVVRVLIENGQPVEYGEPLFELRPAQKKK
jgi:acetyl-CoA carboxylase biotin carboxyl carrier protein